MYDEPEENKYKRRKIEETGCETLDRHELCFSVTGGTVVILRWVTAAA